MINLEEVNLTYMGFGILGAVFFLFLGYMIRKIVAKRKLKSAEEKARIILEDVKREVTTRRKEVDLEAKDLLHKTRVEFEKESREKKQEMSIVERRLVQKEENLDRNVDLLDRKEKNIDMRECSLVSK